MANNSSIKNRANEQIRGVREVRLIDQDGQMLGIFPFYEALRKSKQDGFDLVEINRNSNPPVCKLMDFGKYKYDQGKAAKEARRAQQGPEVKEVVLRPATDTHDILVKAKHIRGWLDDGDKVRIVVKMRGREKIHPDRAMEVIESLLSQCGPHRVEQQPRLEDRIIIVVISS